MVPRKGLGCPSLEMPILLGLSICPAAGVSRFRVPVARMRLGGRPGQREGMVVLNVLSKRSLERLCAWNWFLRPRRRGTNTREFRWKRIRWNLVALNDLQRANQSLFVLRMLKRASRGPLSGNWAPRHSKDPGRAIILAWPQIFDGQALTKNVPGIFKAPIAFSKGPIRCIPGQAFFPHRSKPNRN